MKIYVVMGTTGEYSDRMDWVAKAFTDIEDVREYIKNVSEFANEIFVKEKESLYKRDYYDDLHNEITSRYSKIKELDSNFRIDYTGTSYYYEECELENNFDQFPKSA